MLKIKFVGFQTLGGLFLAGQVGVVPRWGRNMLSRDFTIFLLRIFSLFIFLPVLEVKQADEQKQKARLLQQESHLSMRRSSRLMNCLAR